MKDDEDDMAVIDDDITDNEYDMADVEYDLANFEYNLANLEGGAANEDDAAADDELDPASQNKQRSMHEFIVFSIMLFLIILAVGGTAFMFSMRQIIRTNKGSELQRILENERIKLETFVNNEITIVMKMAESPLIKRYFADPDNLELQTMAFEEIASYRGSPSSSIFWVNDKDKLFYIDKNEPYILDPEAPENSWYNATLYRTRTYNFSINYNPALKMAKLWINAPVFNNQRTEPLGMVGIGVNIAEFVGKLYDQYMVEAELYFFNASGEITGANEVELVVAKEHIEKKLGSAGVGVLTRALNLAPGDISTYDSPYGKVAVGTVPALDWYSIAIMPDTMRDYRSPITVLFLVMLLVIVLILVTFNIFIAGFVKSLRLTVESLETSSRYKSEFLAMMSHEIRTPLNAILGMAELALREKALPRAQEHVLTIKKSGANLLTLINDILDFSKIESGKLEIVPADYHFSSLIKDVTNVIGIRAADSRLEFRIDIDGNIPKALVGDELRIRQIMLNILSNAVKYTVKGFVSFVVKGEKIDDDTVNLLIEVTDSGRGIKQADIGRLFKDFVQIDLVKNKGIEGTGLGLAITKKLVTAMGGDISVQSKYGEGSVFAVRLPQKISRVDDIESDEATEVFTTRGVKALVVDDVATNLVVAQGLLSIYNMEVHTCLSGAEAIEAVRREDYDLVFMDHMMPEMDGIEAAMRIRNLGGKRYEKLPIIALTANAVSGMKEMFKQNGFNDYLSKPIDTMKLNAVLERWIPREKQIRLTEEETAAAAAAESKNSEKAANMKIDGVDVAKGMATARGKLDTYLRILDVFSKDGRNRIGEIKNALDKNDIRLYTTYVHALKSASANVGAMGLSEAARVLEAAGKEGDRAFIDANTPRFLQLLEAVLNNIEKALQAANRETANAGLDVGALKNILVNLKEAVTTVNIAQIRPLMKGLQNFSANSEVGSKVDNVLRNTMSGEYDKAVGLIDELLKSI
jgi:signal transduction histidine kinase/CheY-like chemotaxis protein/HPt (histidine-containing phosphotransfer) domain-containing protein